MSSVKEDNEVDRNNNNIPTSEDSKEHDTDVSSVIMSKDEEEVMVEEAILSESQKEDSNTIVSEEEDDDDDDDASTTDRVSENNTTSNNNSSNYVWKQRQSVLRKHLTNGFVQLSEQQQLKKSKRASPKNIHIQQQQQQQQQQQNGKKHHVVIHILDPTQSTSSTLLSTRGRIPSYTTNRNTSITGATKITTTTSTSTTTPTLTQKGPNANLMTGGPSLDLYKKLTTIFERDYHSTLHGVPYPNIRTGTKELIDSIPCQPSMITHSSSSLLSVQTNPMDWHLGPYCHVYIAACESIEHYRARVRPAIQAFISQVQESIPTSSTSSNNNNNNDNNSTNTNNNINPPTNNLSSNTSTNANTTNVNASPPYVIVYVPLSKQSQDDKDGQSSSSNNNKSQAQQLGGLIRSKISRGNMRTSPSSSHHGGDELTFANTESMEDDSSESNKFAIAAAAPPPGPIFQSKKDVKELHKKFCHDFPYGRTCILSTLLSSSEDSYSPLKNQEWNAFLRALGDAIICGFRQRVDRYNAELNKQQVTTYVQKFQSTKKLDESHFFLVKESLAFTFEQMQLPHQALLIYEELEAFLPQDAIWMEEDELLKKNKRQMKKMASQQNIKLKKDTDDDTAVSLYDIACAGDCAAFRRRISRAATEFKLWSHLILQYLFARQTHLLFQLERPVDIIKRAYTFVRSMYQLRLDAILLLSSMGKNVTEEELASLKIQKQAEAEAWALHTCWDIKCACDVYFSWTEEEREASCRLSDILSFARLRLLKLGDLELSQNPIRMAMSNRPQDTKTPWLSLQELQTQQKENAATTTTSTSTYHNSISLLQLENLETPPTKSPLSMKASMPPDIAASGILENSMMNEDVMNESTNSNNMMSSSSLQTSKRSRTNMGLKYTGGWLRGAFDSREAYELKYLELSKSIISLLERANRFRSAARLQGEEAEIYILRGEYEKAVSTLLPVVDNCAADFWDRAYYWRLFRLACCQRIVSFQQQQQKQDEKDNESTILYLQTLTRCFNPRLALVAPEKTSLLLFRDLTYVVGSQDIPENHRLGISPFLETEICVDNNHRATQTLPYIRRRIYQQFCFVGDTFQLSLIVKSHMPQSITLDGVRLFIVSLSRFEQIHTTGSKMISEEDAYRILHVPQDKIVIKPGENTLDLDWIPMAVGEYALAAVSLKWKHVDIIHESSRLRKPMSGVDVLPSEPTQNMDLNPLFLIPGHTQNVRLLFEAGSDIVEKGSVDLTCSPGLQLLSPTSGEGEGEEAWVNTLSLDLEACQPDSKIVITTTVKSDPIQAYDEHGSSSVSKRNRASTSAIQTMHAKVTTSYYHSLYTELTSVKKEEPEAPSMTTILEAMVTTLDRPALTVGRAEAMKFSEDHVMVHVCLHCNTPVPFYLHEWSITFPPPLRVDQEFNQKLFDHTVVEGEELFFGFRCLRMDTHHYDNSTDDTTTITTTSSMKEDEDRPVLQVILRDEFGKTFRQVLPLDLYDFYEWMKEEDACSNMNTVQAELQSSQTEGVVGSPVIFQYQVDTSMLTTIKRRMSYNHSDTNLDSNKSKTLLFQIQSNPSEWILGGKVQGLIPLSGTQSTFSLEFTGIPTRSGLLNRFPEISLLHHHPENVSSSTPALITVQTKHPDYFKSLSYTNHMALACPSTLEC